MERNKAKSNVEERMILRTENLDIACCSSSGVRLEQEDRVILTKIPDLDDHILLAVLDGHSGQAMATFGSVHFVEILTETSHFKHYVDDQTRDVESLGEALNETFTILDNKFLSAFSDDNSGSTCCAVIITPKYVVCANVGDTRCIMSVGGFAKALSEDHKPDHPRERERIISAGGKVHRCRVDGLAVSRALGDFSFKKNQRITCNPDITVHLRNKDVDEFLFLACDGIWDVFTSAEAMLQITSLLESYSASEKCVEVTEVMLDFAIKKGSLDNVTCILCRFLV